eukprot:16989-Heterococcus_DN1.PRE.1
MATATAMQFAGFLTVGFSRTPLRKGKGLRQADCKGKHASVANTFGTCLSAAIGTEKFREACDPRVRELRCAGMSAEALVQEALLGRSQCTQRQLCWCWQLALWACCLELHTSLCTQSTPDQQLILLPASQLPVAAPDSSEAQLLYLTPAA